MKLVHLLHHWWHLRPTRHWHQHVKINELNVPNSKVCHPDMCIYILLFPTFNFSILMHMPIIATEINILLQICWMVKEPPLGSALSAAWLCSWHPCCRWEQPIEQTWQWWWALIESNRIVEYYYCLQLADTLKYILKNIFICIIKNYVVIKEKVHEDNTMAVWPLGATTNMIMYNNGKITR